jgi:hypothetical protein
MDIALNLNMQVAKRECRQGRFGVRGGAQYSFICGSQDVRNPERFQLASNADWKKYRSYLGK